MNVSETDVLYGPCVLGSRCYVEHNDDGLHPYPLPIVDACPRCGLPPEPCRVLAEQEWEQTRRDAARQREQRNAERRRRRAALNADEAPPHAASQSASTMS